MLLYCCRRKQRNLESVCRLLKKCSKGFQNAVVKWTVIPPTTKKMNLSMLLKTKCQKCLRTLMQTSVKLTALMSSSSKLLKLEVSKKCLNSRRRLTTPQRKLNKAKA